MITIEITTNAPRELVDKFVDLVKAETERVYIRGGSLWGDIDIHSARVVGEDVSCHCGIHLGK